MALPSTTTEELSEGVADAVWPSEISANGASPHPEPAGRAPRRKRTRNNGTMHVSAKVDYAMRALLEIARSADGDGRTLVKGDHLSEAQDIPARFLEGILR